MAGETSQDQWPDLRGIVALGVYLVLLMQADTNDLDAVTAMAPQVAGAAVRATDALLKALKDRSPGGAA